MAKISEKGIHRKETGEPGRALEIVIMPDGTLQPEWVVAEKPLIPETIRFQDEIFRRFESGGDDWLLFAGFGDSNIPLSSSLDYWRSVAGEFIRKLSRTPELETLRDEIVIEADPEELQDMLDRVPLMTGSEYLSRDILNDLLRRLNSVFSVAIRSFEGSVEDFFQSFRPDIHVAGRVYFHLVENRDAELPFAFLATYSEGLNREGKTRHLPLRNALERYGKDSGRLLELLATVYRAADESALIKKLLDTGEIFRPTGWTAGEAFTFLKETPLYEASGVLCRIPNWWKPTGSGMSVSISVGDQKPSFLGMDSVLNFNARLHLDGVALSEDEARRLLEGSEGLAFIKGRWVAADPEKLKKTLEAYEKAKELMEVQGLTIRDALRMQLNPGKWIGSDADEDADRITVSNGRWLESVMKKMLDPAEIEKRAPGKGFKGELRPYQQKGLDWLGFHHSLKFGACLADDMGLGKTIQLLAFLSTLNSKKTVKASTNCDLLIIPASLTANWESEIQRFFPSLKYYIAHPGSQPGNKVAPKTADELHKLDLVVTTYALAQKYEWIKRYSWRYVILDEAQAVKNPGTRQTRAVKKLSAENRIAMTGTPIENRLSDLWSLFDFLNPGLLGTSKEFSSFVKHLNDDPSRYGKLRKIVSPYILRRLKTDKSVISDLPDKVEVKVWTSLSKKQIAFYRKLVEDIRETIEQTEGIQRKGLILASLMKFKQICNHPDQYLGTGGFQEEDSGKFERLRAICETIYEKREKVLVFTQFKEMTGPLSDFLSGVFQREGLVLHGSVPVGKRKKIIEKFQNSTYVPFMVLSLKAGGVGLNLTAANHVVHFDRWWNPAVENQATDRAFRIGQKKNVMVHKFLTKGTVEEKINQMLEEKSALSDEVVAASGENWITEMKNDELMNMFNLSL